MVTLHCLKKIFYIVMFPESREYWAHSLPGVSVVNVDELTLQESVASQKILRGSLDDQRHPHASNVAEAGW